MVTFLVGRRFRVLAAVNLDYQSVLATNKIADVGTDGLSPDKLAADDLPISKAPPELLLCIGLV